MGKEIANINKTYLAYKLVLHINYPIKVRHAYGNSSKENRKSQTQNRKNVT